MPDFGFENSGFDDWVDSQLRNVPVPCDLQSRLLAANSPVNSPNGGDNTSSQDAASGAHRLLALTDAQFDEQLRNIEVPPYLNRRLRAIARERTVLASITRLAIAASVLVATGWVASRALQSTAPGSSGPGSTGTIAKKDPAKNVASPATTPGPAALVHQKNKVAPGNIASQSPRTRPATVAPVRKATSPETSLVESATEKTTPAASSSNGPGSLPFTLRDVAAMSSSIKQAVEAKRRSQAALGSAGQLEPLPELDAFETSLARGVLPPRVRGYDLLFQLKHGEHPFVSPSADARLASSNAPFTFATASYDRAAQRLKAGVLPAADEVRVEDFLAAQRFALPTAPSAGLALHGAGSPAPLGQNGLHVLQWNVQSARYHAVRHAPMRLVAVVETSTAMDFAARSQTVKRAITDLARQMANEDRVTLITFGKQSQVVAENAAREELEKVLASEAFENPTSSADLFSAIQSACDAVTKVPSKQPTRVVFITSGRSAFLEQQLEQAAACLTTLKSANIPWQIMSVSSADAHAQLADLASQSGGQLGSVNSADALRGVLSEALTGRPATIAQGVSLKITFNPEAVGTYRLVGHESATLTGEAGDPIEVDLMAEQTATALYEVFLKPVAEKAKDKDPIVATAELNWRDPASGQPRKTAQSLRRSQLAWTFAQASPALQQGAIAAQVAQMLRGSHYVPASRRFSHLADLAQDIDRRASQTPEFKGLIELVEFAGRLR